MTIASKSDPLAWTRSPRTAERQAFAPDSLRWKGQVQVRLRAGAGQLGEIGARQARETGHDTALEHERIGSADEFDRH